jgi:hypothetical protein
MRVLLLTNNVRSIFLDGLNDSRLTWWLNLLDDTITREAADFVALHLQELSGSACADEEPIQNIAQGVRARFTDFWCSGLFCPPASDPDFTGLGCLVLARRSVAKDVACFDFGSGLSGGWRAITLTGEPLVPVPGLPVNWCRHSSFPRNIFDSVGHSCTRKGWLHTRWRIDGQPLELLNVHLFDDLDHIDALSRPSTVVLSKYAVGRQDALRYALDMLAGAGPAPAALGPRPPAVCCFGDLNFRLDVRRLLEQIADGSDSLARELARAASDPVPTIAVPVFHPVYDEVAGEPHVQGDQSSLSESYHLFAPLCRCLASVGMVGRTRPHVFISSERFVMEDAWAVLGRDPCAIREHLDPEVAACANLLPALYELEVSFPPTCSHVVGTSCAERPAYDGTRCPSWSDRVLLDATGMRLMRAAEDVVYSAGAGEDDATMNSHLLVHLAFTLQPSGALDLQPIGVQVKAMTGPPPVPIKVKYVAVGAG